MSAALSRMLPNKTEWTHEEFYVREQQIVAQGIRLRGPSMVERFARLPQDQRDAFYESLQPTEWQRLWHDWRFWGRPKQLLPLQPGEHDDVLIIGGRGSGKSRSAAECWKDRIMRGLHKSLCFIGPDWEDTRRTMVGGLPGTESGILDVLPPWYPKDSAEGYTFNQNKKEIYIPRHDCTIYLNTGEKKEQRGGNFDGVWIDEGIKFRYLNTVMTNLDLALRKGTPLRMFTTTPQPQYWLMDLMMDPHTLVIHSVTDENASNIAARTLERWHRRYDGTRVGDQEMGARVLGDNQNAIAAMAQIEAGRVEDYPELEETGVALDPAVSTKRKSDDTGAVACGRSGGAKGSADAHMYVVADRSGRYKPDEWADVGAKLAKDWGAKWIVVERNKIGDTGKALLMHALNRAGLAGKVEIREAYSFSDKWTRAQPVSALYDRGVVHHVGRFNALETQLSQWDPTTDTVSPNNLDALVHCAIELMGLAIVEEPIDLAARWSGFEAVNDRFTVSDRDRL